MNQETQSRDRSSYRSAGEDEAEAGETEALGEIDPRQALAAAADFAREHPHAAVGIAVGLGFLLGGGLTPRVLGTIGMVAGRAYLSRTVRSALATAVEERLGGQL